MKKLRTLLALSLVAVMLLSGCGGAKEETSAPAEEKAEAAAPAEKAEAAAPARTDIRLCIASEVTSLDPYNTTASADYQVFLQMYEGMFFLNSELELEPRVAESYSVAEDGMTYTFNIRTYVTIGGQNYYSPWSRAIKVKTR